MGTKCTKQSRKDYWGATSRQTISLLWRQENNIGERDQTVLTENRLHSRTGSPTQDRQRGRHRDRQAVIWSKTVHLHSSPNRDELRRKHFFFVCFFVVLPTIPFTCYDCVSGEAQRSWDLGTVIQWRCPTCTFSVGHGGPSNSSVLWLNQSATTLKIWLEIRAIRQRLLSEGWFKYLQSRTHLQATLSVLPLWNI